MHKVFQTRNFQKHKKVRQQIFLVLSDKRISRRNCDTPVSPYFYWYQKVSETAERSLTEYSSRQKVFDLLLWHPLYGYQSVRTGHVSSAKNFQKRYKLPDIPKRYQRYTSLSVLWYCKNKGFRHFLCYPPIVYQGLKIGKMTSVAFDVFSTCCFSFCP